MIRLISLFSLTIVLCSCSISSDSWSDARFEKVIRYRIQTKTPLILWKDDGKYDKYDMTHRNYHFISSGPTDEVAPGTKALATIPVGHEIFFEKVRRKPTFRGLQEYLVGTTIINKDARPIIYRFRIAGETNAEGLERMAREFKMPQ
jgi:hypothetical protein